MRQNNLPGNRQTKSESASKPAGLLETIKYIGNLFRRNARSIIGYNDFYLLIIPAAGNYLNFSLNRRIFYGIVQEITEYIFQRSASPVTNT
jgi:hypothetical protein